MVLAIFVALALIGQIFSLALGLAVDQYVAPSFGVFTFVLAYFLMFWAAWRVTLLIVDREPQHQISMSHR